MSESLLICKDAIIPIRNLCYIQNNGGYQAAVKVDREDVALISISKEGYAEMIRNALNTTKYKNENKRLKERIQLLEQHISIMPGGTEYLLAEQDFKQAGEKQKI